MRNKLILFLCAVLIVSSTVVCSNGYYAHAASKAEIAMELSTGTVLAENNSNVRLPMASTTKIMTAIIIIEDCDLDEVITVPNEAVGIEGSSIYLKKEEKIDIRDLLYGLMLRSGNDSATALAIHHSGSVEDFAKVMTERARELGAYNTNFTNASGLPDDNHYTTAYDLCIIACHAMKNSIFKNIVASTSYSGRFRNYTNKNKMLKMYEGANGVKTGYTVKAGRCLVSSAERNGMDIVCVVLNCPDMYECSSVILDNCFNDYKLVTLSCDKIFMCGTVLCKLPENESFVAKNNDSIEYKIVPVTNRDETVSIDCVAELEIYRQNSLLFKRKLYSI